MQKLRILFIDIETSPALAYVWGLRDQNITIPQLVKPTSVLCFAASWYGEKPMYFESRQQDGKGFRSFIQKAHDLLSEAEAVCHYNGESFDIPRLNTQFMRLGMRPPPPVPQIDLYRTARAKFGTDSHKLEFLAPYFNIGKKIENAGWPLWVGCMNGDDASWKKMRQYCIGDAGLLPKFYETLLPWIDNHPNMNLFVEEENPVCTNCGSKKVTWMGVRRTTTNVYRRAQCQSCGKWMRSRKCEKLAAPVPVR